MELQEIEPKKGVVRTGLATASSSSAAPPFSSSSPTVTCKVSPPGVATKIKQTDEPLDSGVPALSSPLSFSPSTSELSLSILLPLYIFRVRFPSVHSSSVHHSLTQSILSV